MDYLVKSGSHNIKPLLRALGNQNPAIRIGIAKALGRTKDIHAVPALIRALDDRDEEVSTAAANALKVITSLSFGSNRALWLDWYNKQQK